MDAAIAAGFALAVTFPDAGNIGGGGFMLIRLNGENSFVDYREKAPGAAYRDMYLDENGEVIEGASLYGHLSVGVPGTVAGMWEAHKRFATRPWKDLLQPAVKLASEGFKVPDSLGSGMKSMQSEFAGKTNFDRYFGHMQAGVLFKQPELAATLRENCGARSGRFLSRQDRRTDRCRDGARRWADHDGRPCRLYCRVA